MACVTSAGVRTAGPPVAADVPADPSGIEDDGIMALVVDGSDEEVDGSETEVEGTSGGVEEVGNGSDIEPEIADTRLIGNCALCLVERRL
jgi:hypothetical protein